MKKYYIYRIEFPNGQFYIGQTSLPHVWMRWTRHIDDCKYNKHPNHLFQEIYNEHGSEDWIFETLLELESDDGFYIGLMENTIIDDHPNTINRTGAPNIRLDQKFSDNPKLYRKLYQREHYKHSKEIKRSGDNKVVDK